MICQIRVGGANWEDMNIAEDLLVLEHPLDVICRERTAGPERLLPLIPRSTAPALHLVLQLLQMTLKVLSPDGLLPLIRDLLLDRALPQDAPQYVANSEPRDEPSVGSGESDEEEREEGARDGGRGVVVLVVVRGGEEREAASLGIRVARSRVEERVQSRVDDDREPRKDGLDGRRFSLRCSGPRRSRKNEREI